MRQPPARPVAYQIACRFLARRAHTERELTNRLTRRGCTVDEAAAAIGKLKRVGLVDDAATAALWARAWRDRKRWGPMRVRAELGRRGVGRPLTESILRETFPPDDVQALVEQAAAVLTGRPVFRRASAAGGRQQARWLTAQLQRRGFPYDAIRRVVLHRCPSAQEDDRIGPHVTD